MTKQNDLYVLIESKTNTLVAAFPNIELLRAYVLHNFPRYEQRSSFGYSCVDARDSSIFHYLDIDRVPLVLEVKDD